MLHWLSFEDDSGVVATQLARALADNLPQWVWFVWLPQLLAALQRPEAPSVKPILMQVAVNFPQVRDAGLKSAPQLQPQLAFIRACTLAMALCGDRNATAMQPLCRSRYAPSSLHPPSARVSPLPLQALYTSLRVYLLTTRESAQKAMAEYTRAKARMEEEARK